MGAEQNRSALEQALAIWNAHDEGYFAAYSADAPIHGLPAHVPATVEGMRQLSLEMWEGLPDARVEVHRIIAKGDLLAAHYTLVGTHRGRFRGAAPTGNRIEAQAMSFFRFGADGKVAERWTQYDDITLMTQLGLMPVRAPA